MSGIDEHHDKQAERDLDPHLTLSEEDAELLDMIARRLGVSRVEAISRVLHLAESVYEMHVRAGAREDL